MTTERIIEQILSKCPEISREEILERLEREKSKTGGFISDDSLLRMIAAEFGVEISIETSAPTLSIGDLIPGLNDVTIIGRVLAVFPSKTFKRNKIGRFAGLIVADKNDILRVVLWDDKASLVESGEIRVGQIIRFSHGYTREERTGKVELHIGDKGEIEINPQDVEARDYPTISKFATKIVEITQARRNKKVNVLGTVKELFPTSSFKRQDSSSRKVMRFVLADETGQIPVVVWNEKVDEVEKTLSKGVRLQIINAIVKKSPGEGLEVHVDAGTFVEAVAPAEGFVKIVDLKEGLSNVNVEGEIATKPMLRDVKTSKGELAKLAVFELEDETGRIWISAWRKHADTVSNLRLGEKIVIKNAYVRKGFGEQLEVSTKGASSITILPKNGD